MAAPPTTSLMVGRDAEMAVLQRALGDADEGRGGIVLVTGDAGMGKTRLAAELDGRARADGYIVAWGRCWEGGGAPAYWPWTQIVRALTDEVGPARAIDELGTSSRYLAHIAPELGGIEQDTAPLQKTSSDRFMLFDAVVKLLRIASRERPLFLVLDDLHLADPPSLHLLRFVGRSLSNARVLLLVALESEAAPPEQADMIGAIGREATRVEVRKLGRDDIATMFRHMTGDPPVEPILDALVDATEGNAFFVEESIRLLLAEGSLRRPDHSLGFRVPSGVKALVRRRLSPLSQESLQALSIAAVIGREFDLRTLETVYSGTAPLADVLAEAVAARVIREVSSFGRYAFEHVLIRETLYQELGSADRMRLHREIGEILQERYRTDIDSHLSELAHHFFKAAQAGDHSRTVDYTVRAAEAAAAATAYEEATRLYERALQVAELGGLSASGKAAVRKALAAARERSSASTELHQVPEEESNVFTREGEYWRITFDGRECRLKDSKGARYLARILANPGAEIHCLELVSLPSATPGTRTPGTLREERLTTTPPRHDILDATAKTQYKRRIEDLRAEIDEAEAFNDPERAARAKEELDAIVEHLAAGVGLGGRSREVVSDVERARMSVSKAVRSTIRKLQEHHPALGEHLAATVKAGVYCSYRPDPRTPLRWQTG